MIKTLYINGCSHTAGVELDSWEKGGPSWPKDGTIQDIPQHCYNHHHHQQLFNIFPILTQPRVFCPS